MNINKIKKGIEIVSRVRTAAMRPENLGGASISDITLLENDIAVQQSLKALIRHGFLEQFHTDEKVRGSIGFQDSSGSGFDLYRLGPAAARLFVEMAYMAENMPLAKRIALRLGGIPADTIPPDSLSKLSLADLERQELLCQIYQYLEVDKT